MAEETESTPKIVESFQGYAPPFDASKAMRRMLRDTPRKFLHGLHSVVLTNSDALSRKERDRKTWGRRRVALGDALGYYSQEWRGEPAHITILLDNLEKRMGRRWLRVGLVRDIELSEVFFHELGHHIHRVHRPEYKEREDVADNWSKKLASRFIRGRYWYMLPIAVPVTLLVGFGKDVSKLWSKWKKN